MSLSPLHFSFSLSPEIFFRFSFPHHFSLDGYFFSKVLQNSCGEWKRDWGVMILFSPILLSYTTMTQRNNHKKSNRSNIMGDSRWQRLVIMEDTVLRGLKGGIFSWIIFFLKEFKNKSVSVWKWSHGEERTFDTSVILASNGSNNGTWSLVFRNMRQKEEERSMGLGVSSGIDH